MILRTIQDHIFCGECRGTMIVFEHWFNYTTPLNFTRFKGIIKAFSGIYVPLTSITFPEFGRVCVWRYCGLVTFFQINNRIELKCSFVQCREYHKSWWNGAADLHISLDLLCGITAAELHNSVDLLWHYGCLATQLSRFTLWHNRRRAPAPSFTTRP